jgi:hypothetical protein
MAIANSFISGRYFNPGVFREGLNNISTKEKMFMSVMALD